MAVRERNTKGGVVYYVVTRDQWKRIGSDRREADREDKRIKKAIKAGTWQPESAGGGTSVKKWFSGWLARRVNRSAGLDRTHLEKHVFTREWFADLKMEDVRPPLVQRLVDEIKKGPPSLSPKYVANIYGSLHAGFREAVRLEVIDRDPCLLKPGTISKKTKERTPYTLTEARSLLGSLAGHRLVWVALALYTGMRCGEVCGRRWSDWDREALPLGCLTIKTQYQDQPLKTDSDDADKPRRAPVHPDLQAVLEWWWETGFELTYLRRPRLTDFIVPRLDDLDTALSRSMTYKALEADCKRAGVVRRGQHATRHAFLTQARRGGAPKDIIERVTHNASGEMVDQYTHWEWAPLCEAVQCLPSLLPPPNETASEIEKGNTLNISSDSRTRKEGSTLARVKTSQSGKTDASALTAILAKIRRAAAKPGAISESETPAPTLPRPGLATGRAPSADPEEDAFSGALAEAAHDAGRGRA